MAANNKERTAIIALCGSVGILTVFALVDAYAVTACFSLAREKIPLPDLCSAEHLFRTTLEIAGMAIGLYGVTFGATRLFDRGTT